MHPNAKPLYTAVVFLGLGLLWLAPVAQAEPETSVYAYLAAGQWENHPDSVETDSIITFNIFCTGSSTTSYQGIYNGFRIYSPNGITWTTTTATQTGTLNSSHFGLQWSMHFLSITGNNADTVGFVGTDWMPGGGMPIGFADTVWTISIGPISDIYHGDSICIDSSYAPPGGAWVWTPSGNAVYPAWNGPLCYAVIDPAQMGGSVTCYVDADMDGYGNDDGITVEAPDGSCDTEDGESENMEDCEDQDENVYPGAPEVPEDGIDQDCNGVDAISCYYDGDQDGYGSDEAIVVVALDGSCDTEDNESDNADDCDDTDQDVYPGAPEVPDDGIDQDCNQYDAVTCYLDSDQDGYGSDEAIIVIAPDGVCDMAQQESDNFDDCNDADNTVYPGAVELCDGQDNDCNDILPADETDVDGDGYVICTIDGGGWDGVGGIVGGDDNCPEIANPDQTDTDGDGVGDACESCCLLRGDINHDLVDGSPNIVDLVFMVNYMFNSGPEMPCSQPYVPDCPDHYFAEADINGDGSCTPNIEDLIYLVNYMFNSGPMPVPCP